MEEAGTDFPQPRALHSPGRNDDPATLALAQWLPLHGIKPGGSQWSKEA